MQAFFGDSSYKHTVLQRVRQMQNDGRMVQGHYWEITASGPRGCALGALTQISSGGHEHFPALFGLPADLAHLLEEIYETSDLPYAITYTARFVEAIPIGAVLDDAMEQFAAWLVDGVAPWPLFTPAGLALARATCPQMRCAQDRTLAALEDLVTQESLLTERTEESFWETIGDLLCQWLAAQVPVEALPTAQRVPVPC